MHSSVDDMMGIIVVAFLALSLINPAWLLYLFVIFVLYGVSNHFIKQIEKE